VIGRGTVPHPIATIFGVRFHVLTVCDLIDFILRAAKGPGRVVVDYVNVRTLNLCYRDPWLRRFLNGCDLVFCDGIGVVLGARFLGFDLSKRHRMTCPDYLDTLAGRMAAEGRSLFLLAGNPGIAEKAAARLRERHPGLKVGHHHGFFDKTGPGNEAVISLLREFQPDVLFGMPIQERWISENLDRTHSKIILSLGACLDFYTGEAFRGPRWMTEHGLEWLGRLVTESPKRVWGRYIVGNPLFLFRILLERLRGSAGRATPPAGA
jgi:N-acetylglucosaminyldiphosphoundecaprenol N-acetyl-beta-D-mannosaminyltransferase